MDEEQKEYNEIRDKLAKIIDKHGVYETMTAMADWMADIMGKDATKMIKKAIKTTQEINKEEKQELK